MENKWRNIAIILIAMNLWLLSVSAPDIHQFERYVTKEHGFDLTVNEEVPFISSGKSGKPIPFYSFHKIRTPQRKLKAIGIAGHFLVLEKKVRLNGEWRDPES